MPLQSQIDYNGSFAAQALLQVAENQTNENHASDFDNVLEDSHDILLEDDLEDDEELPGDLEQQEISEGAEAIGDETADLDLPDAGIYVAVILLLLLL